MYKSQNNYAEQKRLDPSPLPEIKRTREQTYCMITFVENYRKCKVIHSDRKQINECLPRLGRSGGELGEGGITKGHEGTFWGNGCVHSLDCGDGFMMVSHVCETLSNGTTNYMHFSVFQLYLNKSNCEPNVRIFFLLT